MLASTTGDTGLIPDRGTKIPHAVWPKNKKRKIIFSFSNPPERFKAASKNIRFKFSVPFLETTVEHHNQRSNFQYVENLSVRRVEVLIIHSCPTHCDPKDWSPPGSSVHGILVSKILECVAMPSSRGSSWPRDRTWVSCNTGRFLTVWATRDAHQESVNMMPLNTIHSKWKKLSIFFNSLEVWAVQEANVLAPPRTRSQCRARPLLPYKPKGPHSQVPT